MSTVNQPTRLRRRTGVLLLCLCVAAVATRGDLTLQWSTIDAGGCVANSGAGLSLSGTIGQPDGNATLAAADWQLVAGFWGAASSSLAGDCTGDGVITFADFVALAGCLTGPDIAPAQGCTCADYDSDGDIDLIDVALLQRAFSAP